MYEHFNDASAIVDGIRINAIKAGSGPALLLLHGHPQTHAIWHKVGRYVGSRLHGRARRSARLWRQRQTRWSCRSQQLLEATHGAGSGRSDAHARFRAVRGDRSRPRRSCRRAHGARSSGRRDETHHARRRADARDVREHVVRIRAGLLALVLSGEARTVSGNADSRGPGSLSEADHRRTQCGSQAVHARGLRALSALPARPAYRARHLRGLPRERDDRSRTRPRVARQGRKSSAIFWRCGARTA